MAKLGSKKRPAVVRVQTVEKAQEISGLCNAHGWQVIVGVEEDKPEELSGVERLLNPDIKVSNPLLSAIPHLKLDGTLPVRAAAA